MTYTATTIANSIDLINRTHYLPAIQRPFVWKSEDILSLFDSLMKGYPISSFLFWEVAPENKRNWMIYKFIENFRFGELHNEIAETDGRDITLVLDGQQRLTSLLIGLRGSYTSKIKNKRWDDPDAWQRERLYLDLMVDPTSVDDLDGRETDAEGAFGLAFFSKQPVSGSGKFWMKVGEVLNFQTPDSFAAFKNSILSNVVDTDTHKIIDRNLDRLHRVIWSEEVICFYTEKNQDYDRALRIFIRANDAGQALSKSDLMLSLVASKWSDIAAREEIYSFVDMINDRLERPNKIDKDFIMKSCLLLSDLDHAYKVKNFTNDNLDIIRKNWDNIKNAIRNTFLLTNRFGIDRDNITSLNALLPICYYLYKAKVGSLDGTAPFDMLNKERVRRWFIAALLNNVFGGASDQTIGVAHRTLVEAHLHSKDFPLMEIYDALSRQRKRNMRFDDVSIENILTTKYGNRAVFLILSLLYEEKSWGVVAHHIDHIIPQASASRKTLLGMNIPVSRIDKIVEAANRIGNLQILTAVENQAKSDGSFNSWIDTRDSSFLQKHFIPEDRDLWDVRRLPEFVEAREKLIRKKLLSLGGDVLVNLISN